MPGGLVAMPTLVVEAGLVPETHQLGVGFVLNCKAPSLLSSLLRDGEAQRERDCLTSFNKLLFSLAKGFVICNEES